MENRPFSLKSSLVIITAALPLFIVSACSKKNDSNANVTIQFGEGAASAKGQTVSQSVSASSVTSGWGYADPTNVSELKCFGIAIGGPTADLQKRVCRDAAGNPVFKASTIAGTFAIGSTASVEVTSGPSRVIYVVGFAAASSTACNAFTDSTGPNRALLSAPFIIGTTTLDVKPGDNAVSLSASLTGATKFESCDGIATGPTPTPTPGPGNLTLLAGALGGPGNTNGDINVSRFNYPTGIAVDASGNSYVADQSNFVIRKISPAGVVTTFAGSPGQTGSTDGTGTSARFGFPTDIAIDSSGNLFVTDAMDHTIRKITSAGVVTTFAGFAGSSGTTNGSGSAARFSSPMGIAIDTSGNLYVADRGNNKIRKITSAGAVTDYAGSGANGSTNTNAAASEFSTPSGVAVDSSGNVYVADTGNYMIRKIPTGGSSVTLWAGSLTPGTTNATGAAAKFNGPHRLVADASGNLYVTDTYNELIRKISTSAVVTTFAGSGSIGSEDGNGTMAAFSGPTGIAIDASSNLYVTETGNNTVRKISPGGVVTTIAGRAGKYGITDSTGSSARFSPEPAMMAVDSSGNLYVADQLNNSIRKITTAGVVSTFAGLSGTTGSTNGSGTSARFANPKGIVRDSAGNFFVADYSNYSIRKITPGGSVTVFAGQSGTSGNVDSTGNSARFSYVTSIAIDGSDNLYVADGSAIRKITPGAVVTTLAGSQSTPGYTDATGAAARFGSGSLAVVADASGVVYVADSANNMIRKVTTSGIVTTFAGAAAAGSTNGTGSAARFDNPLGITIDPSGTLYVADGGNHVIRKITSSAVVTTVVGVTGNQGTLPGALPAALSKPLAVFTANGLLYIASESSILTCEKP